MHKITITDCREVDSGYEAEAGYKAFVVSLTIDGIPQEVTVLPFCGEYDYASTGWPLPEDLAENDEPIQIAIGEYFASQNVDIGTIGR